MVKGLEYKIIKGNNGLFGIYCNKVMVVPFKYRSIKPVEGTSLLLVEGLSSCVVKSKHIYAKNVLDVNNNFVPVYDEDFYDYDIINYMVVPKKADGAKLQKVNNKPYRGYQF